MATNINYKLISEEINQILGGLYGLYISDGRPTKKGGLRFLDVKSNKTFGFEKTRETSNGNLLVFSAPYYFPLENTEIKEKLENELRKSEHSDQIFEIWIRASRDKGKENKNFVEVKYNIPTEELLSDENITKYAKDHNMTNSKMIIKYILKDYVAPFAKAEMDHLIDIIRNLG